MSEGPRRLLDYGDDLNGLLRGALESERSDDVDAARLERIGRRLAAATVTTATTTPVHAASEAAITPRAATKTSWLASKGSFVLLAAVGIGGLATMRLRETNPPPASVPRTETTMTVAAPPPPAPEPATISPADLPSAPAIAPVATTKSPPKPATAAAGASDVDEIALLARAHDALHDDPARSLALCMEHERRWIAGQFAQEREAVAIEALVYLGRRDDAGRRWTAFRERYPSSSHRVHLEGLLAPAQ